MTPKNKKMSDEEYEKVLTNFDKKFGPFKENERSKKLISYKGPLKDGINDLDAKTLSREESRRIFIKCPLYVISGKTVIIPLDGILPECKIKTADTQIIRMACVSDPNNCHVGTDCLGSLLKRLGSLSSQKPEWQLFILHWTMEYEGRKRVIGMSINASNVDIKISILNPHSLDYFVRTLATSHVLEF